MSALAEVAAATTAGLVLDGLFHTVRYRLEGREHLEALRQKAGPFIYVLWHGRLLPLAYLHRGQGIVTLISRSRDGSYLARLLNHWGFDSVRGSSSRGGSEALRGLVRCLRAGRCLAITPDGPRGPMQKLKPGVLVAAQLTGVPILPVAAGATRGWWPGRWDRFLVPQPFATAHVHYAAPYHVPRSASEQDVASMGLELEHILNQLTAQVDRAAQH